MPRSNHSRPRRSSRSSRIDEDHVYDRHNRGNPDPAYAHEEERNAPGPLINPQPVPVVPVYAPALPPRDTMIAGGMEPGGSSRKHAKAKRDKDKSCRHGPEMPWTELEETTFESGPPSGETKPADLRALAQQRVDPAPSGIPDFYSGLRAVPVQAPIDTSHIKFINNPKIENVMKSLKLAEVSQRQAVVSQKPIREEMTFTDSESEDEFVPGTAPMRMIPYTETQGAVPQKLEQPESEPEMTFTDSESETEDFEQTTQIRTMPIPVTKETVKEEPEPEEEMTFTDSESESEEDEDEPRSPPMRSMSTRIPATEVEVKKGFAEKRQEPPVVEEMTFTDSESESEEVSDPTLRAMPMPVAAAKEAVPQKREEPEEESEPEEMTFTDSESETEEDKEITPMRAMTIPVAEESVPEKSEETKEKADVTYSDVDSDSGPEFDFDDVEIEIVPYIGDSGSETEPYPLCEEIVEVKRDGPEEEPEMTFTDSESESEEVNPRSAPMRPIMAIPFTKQGVPQKWEESEDEEMTFTDSESD